MNPTERPAAVQLALRLLYASIALGALGLAINEPPSSDVSAVATYAVAGVSLALNAALVYLAGTGRNWARVAFTVLFLLGTLGNLDIQLRVFATYFHEPLRIAQLAVAFALSVAGIIAWFVPHSNAWFRAMRAERRAA